MGTLHIYVRTRAGRTESMFAAPRGTRVVFHNYSDDERLVVKIRRMKSEPGRRLYRSARIPRRPLEIVVGARDKKAFKVSRTAKPGTTFKYSARIGRARLEDPIIWVPGKVR